MKRKHLLAGLAAAVLAAQPALAADDFRHLEARPEHRSAAFAGARLRVPLGGDERSREAPSARFQLGVDHVYEDRRSAAPARAYRTSGLELGFARGPNLFVAGAPAHTARQRLGISTGGAIAIGAAVTLVALVAVAAAAGPPDEITP
jgi:hypothetical protein